MSQDTRSSKCWICGSFADSSEHKVKHSLLRRTYGKGPWTEKDSTLGHVASDSVRTLQSCGSKRLKYSPTICQGCNSDRTSKADRAADEFSHHWLGHFGDIQEAMSIDLNAAGVSPSGLRSYLAKLFGCRVAEEGWEVPRTIGELATGTADAPELRISFAINTDMCWFSEVEKWHAMTNLLKIGRVAEETDLFWGLQHGPFRIDFQFGDHDFAGSGPVWTPRSDLVRLSAVCFATPAEGLVLQEANDTGKMLSPKWVVALITRHTFKEPTNPHDPWCL
jgi:hypothetical protein